VSLGGLPSLVALLQNPHVDAQEGSTDYEILDHVTETLMNVARRDNQNREAIVSAGALAPLLSHIQNSLSILDNTIPQAVQQKLLRVVVNLSIANSNKDAIREAGGIAILIQVLASAIDDVKFEATTALANLSLKGESKLC
jgi:hypothetical protein